MSASVADLPRWKCHKEVWAVKIGAIRHRSIAQGRGGEIVPADEAFAPIIVDERYLIKHNPQVGGYFVVYNDGYQSFSPAQAFEEGYSRI